MLPDIRKDPISGVRPYLEVAGTETRLKWEDQNGNHFEFNSSMIKQYVDAEETKATSALELMFNTARQYQKDLNDREYYMRRPTRAELIEAWNEYAESVYNSLAEKFKPENYS